MKKVQIFTDAPEDYNTCLGSPQPGSLAIHPCSEALTFDVQSSLSPWSTFQNKEAVSQFEAGQLN